MGASSGIVGQQLAAAAADGHIRIVVDLAAAQVGHVRVEQRSKRTQNAALGLAAQSQQNEIVPRKNCVDDLRHDGVVIADDAGKHRIAGAHARHEIVAHLVLHAPAAQPLFGKLVTATKLTQGLWKIAQALDTSRVPAAVPAGGPNHTECLYSTPARDHIRV